MAELSIAWIRAATRGDRKAVRALVDLLLPTVQSRVARALLRRGGPDSARDVRQEMEDLIQSVFLVLFNDGARALLRWTPDRGMSFDNYVGLLAEREAISILRSLRRSPWTEEPTLDDELHAQVDMGPAMERMIGSREVLLMLVERAQARLNERNLELFHLIVMEERSVEEICTLMGMTPEAVYSARSRLARLARAIAVELLAKGATGTRRA